MKGAKGKAAARVSKEALKPADDRRVSKRKAAATKVDDRNAKREKKIRKDSSKPKRPPSAFFVFLEEFRKTFKNENPNVTAVSAVGKAAGEKWRSMSPAEKAPFESKAGKLKAEYGEQMNAYNKKRENNDGDEASDRSNDEDDGASGEEEHKQEQEQGEEEEEEEDEDDD